MTASIEIETLDTVIIVDDDNLPEFVFVMRKSDKKPAISKYIKLSSLPKELQISINKALSK